MATPQQSPGFRLEVRRTFAAPREKVFAAWTQREQLERWMCKDIASHEVRYGELDVRAGGRYVMEVRDSATGDFYKGQGVYREVKPPEKLVFTWAWTKRQPDGRDGPLHPETQVTVEFFVRGASTEVVLTHEIFRTAKDRDEHNQGWTGCFEALAQFLGRSKGETSMPTPEPGPETRLQIRRVFATPRAKVFAAWTDRAQLEKWMCKDNPSNRTRYSELDVRAGGTYRHETIPQSGERYLLHGTYLEVRPPEKIVFTWAWERHTPQGSQVEQMGETLVTVEFFERGASTEVVLTHERFANVQLRDRHDMGWNGCFQMLASLLDAAPNS